MTSDQPSSRPSAKSPPPRSCTLSVTMVVGRTTDGPRRPRVRRLVQHRGQPRKQEDPACAHGHQHAQRGTPLIGRSHGADDEHHDRGGEQPHRPVVRQQESPAHEGHADQPRPLRSLERVGHQQVAAEDEEHDECVHARLGRVPDGERRQRQQHDDGPTGACAADASAGQPSEGQREDREDPRERTNGHVGLAEHPHPPVQQEVEQRRVPVLAQGGADVTERQPGDVDRQRLVEPQIGPGPEPQHEPGDDHARHHDGLDPGQRSRPARGLSAGFGRRRGGLGVGQHHVERL